MSSKIATIAEAVKELLNTAPGGTFSKTFTAERKYVPLFKLKNLAEMKVSVVPASMSRTLISRGGLTDKDVVIDIGIHQRLPEGVDPTAPGGNPVIDALEQFAEELAEFFKPGPLGTTGASWLRTDHDPIYDPDRLLSDRVFFSLISVVYRR